MVNELLKYEETNERMYVFILEGVENRIQVTYYLAQGRGNLSISELKPAMIGDLENVLSKIDESGIIIGNNINRNIVKGLRSIDSSTFKEKDYFMLDRLLHDCDPKFFSIEDQRLSDDYAGEV